MNKYPAWLNVLVLAVLLIGALLALPNIYGSVPAVQLAANDGADFTDAQLQAYVTTVEESGIEPEAAYIVDGRAVLRFDDAGLQKSAFDRLRDEYSSDAGVAMTLAPKLPGWVRSLGLSPMSLGLDLRGGVYVLLEVDMASAIASRLVSYEQDFADRLREARLRNRVELQGNSISVRLTSNEDMQAAQQVFDGAVFDDLAMVDDGDIAAEGFGLFEIMRGVEHRQTVLIQCFYSVEDSSPGLFGVGVDRSGNQAG